ncbi:MAG TPA: hypothetical protein PLD90_15380 [Rhodocyclaceae bacterium]|nr:hypothetical protein [Rhodocyclaceae bacterium]
MKNDTPIDFLIKQRRECQIAGLAYSKWLSFLTPIRWATVVIGVVFPSLAGFSLLSGKAILGIEWKTISAYLVFFSSIVAALHAALHCESHQAECKRLRNRYQALIDEIDNIMMLQPDDLKEAIHKLHNQLKELKENTTEEPPIYYRKKAEAELKSSC